MESWKKMNKKVLLLHIPEDKTLNDDYHYGLACISANLEYNNIECEIIDRPNYDVISNKVLNCLHEYDLIGMSTDIFSYEYSVKLAKMIKEKCPIPIIIGGVYATFNHIDILNTHNYFDAIVRGEGETALVSLCEDWFKNNCFTVEHPGVSYLNVNGKKVLSNKKITEENLNQLRYFKKRPLPGKDKIDFDITNISIGRGCIHNCVYCCGIIRSQWRGRYVSNIVAEIKNMYDTHNNKNFSIDYADPCILFDPERILRISYEINEYCGKNIVFTGFVHPLKVIETGIENLQTLKNYGCSALFVGIENASQVVLDRYNRKYRVEDNLEAINLLRKSGIETRVGFIPFDPETTIGELKENLRFIKEAGLFGYWMDGLPIPYNCLEALNGNIRLSKYNKPVDEYFVNDEVKSIYQVMMQFKENFQHRIDQIYANLCNAHIHLDANNYFELNKLPYYLLNELVQKDHSVHVVVTVPRHLHYVFGIASGTSDIFESGRWRHRTAVVRAVNINPRL